jgi:uncharacterized membrane protein YdjX (TVP38/TMEM64 family)
VNSLRLAFVLAGLALALLAPFLLLGERFDILLGGAELGRWFAEARSWAWLAGLGLLTADLLLPVPATGVMAALGLAYGPVIGGLLSALGSFLAGALGYTVCHALGSRPIELLLDPAEIAWARRLSRDAGGWLVAGSRALPLLPEVVACAAGLIRMPPTRYLAALACGAVPTGFVFATLGHLGADRPILTFLATTMLPMSLWLVLRRCASSSGDDALQEQGKPERGCGH